jgi:hypothetical protein
MNKDNYVSLEVAQRLVDAEIVLETDMSWYFRNNEWILRQSGSVYEGNISIPAPCFAELWRELPGKIVGSDGIEYLLNLDKTKVTTTGGVVTIACYEDISSEGYTQKFFANINPADALAELLIWVKVTIKNLL